MMARKRSGSSRQSHPEGRLRDEILSQIERVEAGAWADRLQPGARFSADDRRRITEYVGGITRRRRWLDFLIDQYSSRAEELDVVVRQILRIGIYELVELGRAPHASVFASVEQAKRYRHRGVGAFVNGVLRSVSRSLDLLPTPQTGDDVVNAAIAGSHPDWMVRRWSSRFGLDGARALMDYNNGRPVHCIRVNTLKTSVEDFKRLLGELEVEWTDSPYLPGFLRITRLQPLLAAGVFRSGIAAVQDESAGIIDAILTPKPGEFIVDACAAPGGKLIHAGILMNNEGRLVGIDSNGRRLAAGLDSAQRHGLSIVEVIEADFRSVAPSRDLPAADAVLLDAPCSGLGVLSRRSDLRWRRGEESLAELTVLQDELLEAAVSFVRPGGRLIYATCTITPEENERRVEAFLERHGEFSLESVANHVPAGLEKDGYFVSLPHVHGIDGAFGARLVRR